MGEKPKVAVSAKLVKELRDQSGAGMMDCKKALAECGGDIEKADEYLRKKGIVSAAKKASRVASEGMVSSYIHAGSRIGVLVEVNCETDFVEAEKQAEMQKEDLASKPENIREKIVEGRVEKIINERALLEQTYIMDTTKTVREAITESIASIGENIKVRRFSRYVLGEGIEKKTVDFATEVEEQTKAKSESPAPEKKEEKVEEKVEEKPAVAISAKLVKELRDSSGAGMMDCKKALAECGGDLEKAEEYLRKKGITSAAKKASRVASEGMVSSYIHAGSRIGVLVEVNCETDFVARGDKFKELVQGLA